MSQNSKSKAKRESSYGRHVRRRVFHRSAVRADFFHKFLPFASIIDLYFLPNGTMPPPKMKNTQESAEKSKQPKLTDYGLRSDTQKANANASDNANANARDCIASSAMASGVEEERSQNSKVDEILTIVTAIKCDLDNIRRDIKDCSERVTQAEARISNNEDEVVTLRAKVSSLETKQKGLESQVMDLESRSRRNNIRIINLAEGTEGKDPCLFLEKWLPEFLDITSQSPMLIERAHRIGPRRADNASPRTLILKFLNYRDKEAVLFAAKAKGDIRYNGHWIRFYADLAASVQQLRKRFVAVREELRQLGLRNGVTHQGKLLVTYEGKTFSFTSPAEAQVWIKKIQNDGEEHQTVD